jgi:enoyl-[acyl-carrier-protein] reductase (NADH)
VPTGKRAGPRPVLRRQEHIVRGIVSATLSGGKPFAEFEKEFFKTFRPSSLLKRFAMTEEVANLVTYVCSPLSAATNGAALRVDGGVVQACF